MNTFFAIILAALLLEFAIGVVAELLNLRALKPEPPQALTDVYRSEEYRRSQEYTRAQTRFGLVSSAFSLIVLLGFWFAGGFDFLDGIVRGWGYHVITTGLLYIGALLVAYYLVSLPFGIYSTFVIEERFGFNKTTPRTFAVDQVKMAALTLVLGGPLLAGILAFFEYAGPLAWLYCWIGVTLFSLALGFVAPTWIMPLFNKFTPLESGELRGAIQEYASEVDFKFRDVFVLDGSKRSSHSNAFFTGFGRNKRIALFDTLVEKHTVPQLVAVLAHEIGHYKQKHVLQAMAIGVLHTGALFFLLSIFLGSAGLYEAFFMDEQSTYAGLLFFALLYTPIEVVLSIAMHMVSRRNEYAADRWSAETYRRPESLVQALKKISADNLSNLEPHPFFVLLNYSHPPLLQRVRAIERRAG